MAPLSVNAELDTFMSRWIPDSASVVDRSDP